MNDDKNLETLCSLSNRMCSGLVAKLPSLDVACNRMKKSRTIVISVACDPSDFGKLIGKEGGNFRSMELILNRTASLLNEKIEFSIPDPGSEDRSVHTPFRRAKDWKPAKLVKTIEEICKAVLVHDFEHEVVNGKLKAKIELSTSEDEMFASDHEFERLSEAVQKIVHAHARNQGWEAEFNMVRS